MTSIRFLMSKIALSLVLVVLTPGARSATLGSNSSPVVAASTNRQYVNSLGDFVDHVQSHIERTTKLGMYLYKIKPELFKGINPRLLYQFLSLHDQAKINPALSAGRAKTFARELYENYTKDKFELSADQRANLLELTKHLNEADAKVAHDFFERNSLLGPDGKPAEIAKLMLIIEKVADQVDRYRDKVSSEEFGKKMKAASVWMERANEKELAKLLEDPKLYKNIVSGSTFGEYRRRSTKSPLSCVGHEIRTVLEY